MNEVLNNTKDPDHRKILNLYAAFGVGILLTLVPMGLAAGVSLLFITGTLITAYVLRGSSVTDSLLDNHTTYIIRTIWIGTLFSIFSTILGSVYMHFNLDFSTLESCALNLAGSAQRLTADPDIPEMMALLGEMMGHMSPCLEAFYKTNLGVFFASAAIAASPVLIYFAVRYTRGLSRALKGYRLANPLSWL